MRRNHLISALGTAVLLAIGTALPLETGFAQRAGGNSDEEEGASRRSGPSMRITVYEKLAEAQECSENDDIACAQELLEEVSEMSNLNSYEMAQLWTFYAFIYFNQDNYPEAIRAYENVLAIPELPEGNKLDALNSLTRLLFQEERYSESLARLDEWFALAADPGPEQYILKAQLFYAMEQYRQGIDPVLSAIAVAEQRGTEVKENWFELLNVFYFELENYPKVIETMTTLATRWPRGRYFITLAGVYGQEGDETRQLALFEAAYEMGWLNSGSQHVTLSQMLMQADAPYKAARIMQAGLESGFIEADENNWRLYAQALQLAREDERALPAWRSASEFADDGRHDFRLAQSYSNLARWQECVDSARSAIRRGGLPRTDQANLILGNCLLELKDYEAARTAITNAAQDSRSRANAATFLQYIDAELARQATNARTRRTL